MSGVGVGVARINYLSPSGPIPHFRRRCVPTQVWATKRT
jgi:hypothetical protein